MKAKILGCGNSNNNTYDQPKKMATETTKAPMKLYSNLSNTINYFALGVQG